MYSKVRRDSIAQGMRGKVEEISEEGRGMFIITLVWMFKKIISKG